MPADTFILETKDIVKNFPGVRALDKVSISIKKGEVHGILGENGAGKSTLMNILSGALKPDSGKVIVDNEEMSFASPREASMNGIEIVHQELSLVPNLSISENIFANRQPINKFLMIDQKKMNSETRKILALFEMENLDPSIIVSNLTVAHQQVIEILKAIAKNPKILILDEPTSSLTQVERGLLFKNIDRLKNEGTSIIYISHHLNEIFQVCDRVTILKDGKYIVDKNVEDIDEEFIISKMVGREILNVFGEKGICEDSSCCFEVRNLTRKGYFNDVSFSVKKGEILGFYGLVGAGRTEVAQSLFGIDRIDSGEVYLEGIKFDLKTPKKSIKRDVGYMTEDRKDKGLYLKMGVSANMISNRLTAFSKGPFLNNQLIVTYAKNNVEKYKIATPNLNQNVENLSGGNQQKVLIATWFSMNPKVLIIDEPTKGVDVGARSDIYTFIRNLAKIGASIIILSSDLLEILGLSDRIMVMKNGEIVGEFDAINANEEKVIALATGVNKKEIDYERL